MPREFTLWDSEALSHWGETCAQGIRGVKIGNIFRHFQPKTLIPKHKNQKFQKFFNYLVGIELRESRISIQGLFSYQKRR